MLYLVREAPATRKKEPVNDTMTVTSYNLQGLMSHEDFEAFKQRHFSTTPIVMLVRAEWLTGLQCMGYGYNNFEFYIEFAIPEDKSRQGGSYD